MKNLQGAFLNGLLAVIGIFFFIFMSIPYTASGKVATTGYGWYEKLSDLWKLHVSGTKATQHLFVIVSVMLFFFISLFILCAILNILFNLDVFKANENPKLKKVSKILNIVLFILSIIFLGLMITSIVSIVDFSSDHLSYAFVLNLLCSMVAVVAAIYNLINSRVKKN